MGTRTTSFDPYAVLGVAPDSPRETIAAAHRRLARRHHPDVSHEPGAERRMSDINAAWTLLRDEDRRRTWNREHGLPVEFRRQPAGPTDSTTQPSSASGPRSASPAPSHGESSAWRRGPYGEGAAGPPPGPRRGSILTFGRHIGWSLGEIARVDPGYLEWLHGRREGAPYRAEIEALLATGRPAEKPSPAAPPRPSRRRRLFR